MRAVFPTAELAVGHWTSPVSRALLTSRFFTFCKMWMSQVSHFPNLRSTVGFQLAQDGGDKFKLDTTLHRSMRLSLKTNS